MSNISKMDVSTVYEMFEEINEKLDKRTTGKPVEPVQVDLTAVNAVTERLENAIEEANKSAKVEHQHRHLIDIHSNWVFLSLVVMTLIILGMSYMIGEQRRSLNQYKNNDLKYRYIKMQGQTDEGNIYRLERQFQYSDSIKIVQKQVEKYEDLVNEQANKLERARRNNDEVDRLKEKVESLKNK